MDICEKLDSMIVRTVKDDLTHHEAAQEIRRLRAALKEYGRHDVLCDYHESFGEAPCDCGFDEAMKHETKA